MRRENELSSLENFVEYKADKNFHIKSMFCGLIEYTEMYINARTFDRDFNKFKEKKINLEKITEDLSKTILDRKDKIQKLEEEASKYYIPCLKKEKEKILNKIIPIQKNLSKWEDVKNFFDKFNELTNDEQFYYLCKHRIISF